MLNLPGWELEVPHVFAKEDRHPQDVVMVCKQFWASDRLAQPPLLWIPHAWFARLKRVPWARNDRNPLSDRQCKEYRQTAVAVIKKPWCLLRAGAYLDEWVANNTAGTYGWPPHLGFLADAPCEPSWASEMAVEWRDYAPAPPVRINIGPERNQKKARLAVPEDVVLPADVEAGVDLRLPEDDGWLPEENVVLPADVEAGDPLAPAPPAGPELGGIAAAPAPHPGPVLHRPAAAVLRRAAAAPAPTLNMGLRLGCSKCRRASGGCVQCRPLAWRQARVAREARLALARSSS